MDSHSDLSHPGRPLPYSLSGDTRSGGGGEYHPGAATASVALFLGSAYLSWSRTTRLVYRTPDVDVHTARTAVRISAYLYIVEGST
jgi:hypothetical protein